MELHRRSWIEEWGYRESLAQLNPNVQRCDDLTAAAIERIERDADSCEIVGTEPLMEGHGPLRVSQASTMPGYPEFQIFFTLHDPDDDQCSLWEAREVPEIDDLESS